MAHCNGTHWDQRLCQCSDKLDVPLSCDFELDECGWRNWKRSSSWNASQSGAGPSHDHTLNQTNKGHFMQYDSDRLFSVATLLSPVYPAELSRDGCFQFAYYVYGYGFGHVYVYMQHESVKMVSPVSKHQYSWELPLSERNVWKMASFPLRAFVENFRFSIQAYGSGGLAIDDFKLIRGSEC